MLTPGRFPKICSMACFDFYVLTLVRSGSHMLASALDSHPEIQCKAEAWRGESKYPWLGAVEKRVKGTTMLPHKIGEDRPSKAIVLTRRWQDRIQSVSSPLHHLEPGAVEVRRMSGQELAEIESDALERDARLMQAAEKFDCLFLDYSDITGDADCREIPEPIAQRICSFLCVNYSPLRPRFYKPSPNEN